MALNDKVMFKLGTQAKIDEMIIKKTGYSVGTFYLTKDSDRLYVGQATGLKLLNKSVQVVETQAGLETLTASWGTDAASHKDDLAYISGQNILAYFNGKGWTQINPDNNDQLKSVLVNVEDATKGAKVTTEVTVGEIVKSDAFTITGANGAKVERVDGNNIKVTGDTYTMAVNADTTGGKTNDVDIDLTSSLGQAPSKVHLVGGKNVTISKGTANNTINIEAKDTTLSEGVASITSAGKLTVEITDTAGKSVSPNVTLGAYLDDGFHAIGGDTKETKSQWPVYTKDQVDDKFKTLNPMRYRGTLGDAGQHNITIDFKLVDGLTDVSAGDMFLVSGSAKYGTDKTAKSGDILIASGTENDDGVFDGDHPITWNFIPSGDEQALDTRYIFTVDKSTNTMTIYSNLNGAENNVGKIQLLAGSDIELSTTTNDEDPDVKKGRNQLLTTIAHAALFDATKNISNSTANLIQTKNTFNAIKNITVNKNGHVTAIETETVTPITYTPGLGAVDAIDNGVKLSYSLNANDEAVTNKDAYFNLTSTTLSVTAASSATASVELLWGEF